MKSFFISTFLVILTVVAVYAQNPMRAGQWEVSVQMQMPGMQMPTTKSMQCVTAAQLAKDPATGLPTGMQSLPNACKVSDYKVTGSTVTWKMACTGATPMTGEGELVFAGDAYDGTIKMAMQQGGMTMKMSGKRLGDCTQ